MLFGLSHLTNVINGSPLQTTLTQVLLATLSGAILYTFRCFSGLLVVAMIAHSLWDISLFLPAVTGTTAAGLTTLATLVVVSTLGLVTLIFVEVRDRHTRYTA